MPDWFSRLLIPVGVYVFFFLAGWFFGGDAFKKSPSRRAHILSWAAVAVMGAGILWYLWYESMLPYIRSGRMLCAVLAVLQLSVMLAGVALMVYGLLRFYRSGGLGAMVALSLIREVFRRAEHIPGYPTRRKRLAAVWGLILNMLLVSGLGWMCIGLGLAIASGQLDPDFAPDVPLIILAIALILTGGLQELLARQKESTS